ncbi:MAG: transposase [Deltaproteobacteria bacterium]|nr:transposase [Deltaproteobacteria bacterium]
MFCKTVYLRDYQHISYERIAELLSDVFGVGISEATVVSMVKETENSNGLNKFETAAIKDITESPRVNADRFMIITLLCTFGKIFLAPPFSNWGVTPWRDLIYFQSFF